MLRSDSRSRALWFCYLGVLSILMAGCGSPLSRLSAPQVPGEYWPTRGWRTSTPEAQGLSGRRIASMLQAVEERGLGLHSLLIIRHGYIVSESYYASNGTETLHELYSCTKSFVATLTGIALQRGDLPGLDEKVLSAFPEHTFANVDSRKQAMTLSHLLTMTSGLDWQEGDPTYMAMYRGNDWVGYVLDIPMREPPGERFSYCSGCSHVIAAMLQQHTGADLRRYAERHLFQPLGIRQYVWETDASGIPIGGWGLRLSSRDLAKLGYLYLHEGLWDGQQIVPAEWVREATRAHVATGGELGYGYQWWAYPRWGAYAALGRGGQTVLVLPELDLVVITTAAMEGHEPIFSLIEEFVVPAAQPTG